MDKIFMDKNLPSIHLTMAGEGQAVRTRGEVIFPKPLKLKLEPWNIPTNLIHEPLISFTAVRGVNRAIESLGFGGDLRADDAPEQLFVWALRGSPFEYYLAAVLRDPPASFSTLSDKIMTDLNPILTRNGWGPAKSLPGSNAMVWSGMPFFEPFIRLNFDESGHLLFGGFYPTGRGSQQIPPELLAQIIPDSDLIYYDWEFTQERGIGWLYLAQTLRMIFKKAQIEDESAGLSWVLAVSPKLGNSVTALRLATPNQLTISRTSSIGFTGMELQVFLDWLEAPDFPSGFKTFSVPPKRSNKR